MQNVSQNYLDFINDNNNIGRNMKNKVVIDNVEYFSDVIKSNPKISHKATSFIGGFPAKTCEFEILNIDNSISLNNKEIEVYKGLEINGSTEWVKMGIFKAKDEDITNNLSSKSISFKGTDRRLLFDKVYHSDLTYPATGRQIIQDICNTLGVTLETTNFNMANYTWNTKPNFSEATTFTEAVARMAEAGGEIAYISRNGGLRIVGQTPTGQKIPKSKRGTLTKENKFGSINTVVLGRAGYDDDIVYPAEIAVNRIEWKITDNPYFDLNREEIVETIAKHIIGKSVIPYTIENFVDDFIYDLNDVISVVDNNGNTFNAVVLQYETTSRIKSKISVPAQTETSTNYNAAGNKDSNKISNSIKLVVNHLEKAIEAIASKLIDTSAYIEQVTGIGIVHLTDTIKSDAMIKRLVVKGFQEQDLYLGQAYLSDETYLGSSTHYCILEQEIVEDVTSENYSYNSETEEITYNSATYNNEELTIDDDFIYGNGELIQNNVIKHDVFVSEPLRSGKFNGITIYDELVVEDNKCYVIRRLGKDANNNLYVLDETITEDYGDLVLSCFEDKTNILLEYYSDVLIECLYMKKNEYVDYFATEVLNNGNFAITNENITSKVSQNDLSAIEEITAQQISNKVSKNNIISEINQSAELVKILAKKIQLEGYTTINGGFAVDEQGNASIANGAVNINNEGIQMKSGTQIVGGDGMLTNLQYMGTAISASTSKTGDFDFIGASANEMAGINQKTYIQMFVDIPAGFTIKRAVVTLYHQPVKYGYHANMNDMINQNYSYAWGYTRNIGLFKGEMDESIVAYVNSEYFETDPAASEISGAFGANGFTPSVPNDNNAKLEVVQSADFASELEAGTTNRLIIQTRNDVPAFNEDSYTNDYNCLKVTGRLLAVLDIYGYMNI